MLPVIFKILISSNAHFLISLTEEGIKTSFNDVHPWKAYLSIKVTDEGIFICVKDEHP